MKILQILGLKKSDKDKKAQERIARQLKRNQEKLIDDLDAKRDTLLAKKEKLESITVDMKLLDKEIEIANETLNDMFNEKTK